jgi:hypothetical protein
VKFEKEDTEAIRVGLLHRESVTAVYLAPMLHDRPPPLVMKHFPVVKSRAVFWLEKYGVLATFLENLNPAAAEDV